MKQDYGLILGLILFVAVLGSYGYLVFDATKDAGPAVVKVPQQVRLDESSLVDLRLRSINGELPIRVDQSQLGNSDPFRRTAE